VQWRHSCVHLRRDLPLVSFGQLAHNSKLGGAKNSKPGREGAQLRNRRRPTRSDAAVQVTIPSVDEQQAGMDEGRRNEDSIKNEILQTRSNRAIRFPQVQGTILVSEGPFAAPSVECAEHFRDGHYFGCIALTQAVLEAVIRHAWQMKLKKKPNQESSFDKNLEALHKRRFITDEWKTKLNQMWAERHSFQHLRPSVESDQKTLEEKARKNLNLLNELEQTFFSAKLPARLRFGRLLIQDSVDC
jgi:hypothetical protein